MAELCMEAGDDVRAFFGTAVKALFCSVSRKQNHFLAYYALCSYYSLPSSPHR